MECHKIIVIFYTNNNNFEEKIGVICFDINLQINRLFALISMKIVFN